MGRRLTYPDVPAPKIHEIYQRSLPETIHAYGFYIDPVELYFAKRERQDLSPMEIMSDMHKLLWRVKQELLALGLHTCAVAYIPTPRHRAKPYSGDQSWLIILETGFNKTPHLPISDELTERVRAVLKTKEPPAWWAMRTFTYPPAQPWIAHRESRIQQTEAQFLFL